MKLKEISYGFVEWEKKENLYSIHHNDFPIYTLIRPQLYESILLGSDLDSLLFKDTNQTKVRLNYFKLVKNVISFVFAFRKIKSTILAVSNAENRRFNGSVYYDIYFDKIVSLLEGKASILEFPKIGIYHYDNSYNKEQIVKGDAIYVLERIARSYYDSKLLETQAIQISLKFAELYERLYHQELDTNTFKSYILKKFKRNLGRLGIYRLLLKFANPDTLILKSAYSPQSQILLYWAKKMNIKTLELQHGHIYPLHIGYIKPMIEKFELFPDHIFLWSKYYKRTLIQNRWNPSQITVTGDYSTFQNILDHDADTLPSRLKKFISGFSTIITVIGQHSINEVFLEYLKPIEMIPKDVGVILKFHPKYGAVQEAFFKSHLGENANLYYLLEGNIINCFRISDLAVGVYSTALIEAIEMKIKTHLIQSPLAEIFEDFVNGNLVMKSEDIYTSVKMLKQVDVADSGIEIRESFKKEWFKNQDVL